MSKAWYAGCHERMRTLERDHWRSRTPEWTIPPQVSVRFPFHWSVGILPEIMRELASKGTVTYLAIHCACSELPNELFLLDRLFTLHLDCPRLSTLGKDVKKLRNLGNLIVFETEITSLPDELAQLPILWRIHARNNRLRSLPDNLHLYPNLGYLDVTRNPIPWGDKELKFPPSLKTFWYTEEETGTDVVKTFS